MSLEPEKICETCGENINGYGHRPECSAVGPEGSEVTGQCSRCGMNSVFPWDADEKAYLSVCCARAPIDWAGRVDAMETDL